jgi:hypothetical protein
MHFSHLCCLLFDQPSHPPWVDHLYNIWRVQIVKLQFMKFSPASSYPNILLSTLFSDTPNLFSVCNIRDQMISVGFWRWCVSIEWIALFGLYPSSGVSKNKQNWGIKNIDKISQYTHPQNSHKDQLLTTEQLTWAHTHMNPWSKSDTGGNKWPSHCTLHGY